MGGGIAHVSRASCSMHGAFPVVARTYLLTHLAVVVLRARLVFGHHLLRVAAMVEARLKEEERRGVGVGVGVGVGLWSSCATSPSAKQ